MSAKGQKLTRLHGYVFCGLVGGVHDEDDLTDCVHGDHRPVFIYANPAEGYGEGAR